MFDLVWDKTDERYYEHGLDRGVLYPSFGNPVPWNGLIGFDESGGGETSMLYRDGVVYLADVDASDFSGKLDALFFPDEFRACLGMPEVAPGMFVDNQKPKRFGFSYRTLVGSGLAGDMFGYQIHLVYNAMASVGSRRRESMGSKSDPLAFSFDIVCTPVKLQGYRPTAHYILDTRSMNPAVLIELEKILYGPAYGTGMDIITEPITEPLSGSLPGRLPTPTELYDIITAA